MKPDHQAELIVAMHYLDAQLEPVSVSAIRSEHFRAHARIGECWRRAQQLTAARESWLMLDIDPGGVLHPLLSDMRPFPTDLVRTAERKLIEIGAAMDFREGIRRALDPDRNLTASELASEARLLVGELESQGPVRAETFMDVGSRLLKRFIATIREPDAEKRTLPMPTKLLNEALGGWRRGKVHLIGAITSAHKTTVARKSIEVACKAGLHGLYWTAEDSNDDIAARTLACNIDRLSVGMLETMDASDLSGDDLGRVIAGADKLAQQSWPKRLRMIDKPNPTLAEVVGTIRQQASKPLDFVVFDFLQLIRRVGKDDENSHWHRCTAELRALAQQLDIAIICPVQPTQEGTKRVEDGKPLRTGDLRGGQSIAANAYGVLVLHVEDKDGARAMTIYVRKWKGAGRHKLHCWVTGASDDFGDITPTGAR